MNGRKSQCGFAALALLLFACISNNVVVGRPFPYQGTLEKSVGSAQQPEPPIALQAMGLTGEAANHLLLGGPGAERVSTERAADEFALIDPHEIASGLRHSLVDRALRPTETFNLTSLLGFSEAAASDWYGLSVDLSGATAVIGIPHRSVDGKVNQGVVLVYVWSGANWIKQAELIASDGAAGDWFGTAVALSGDTVVVGAPYVNGLAGADQGSSYVFKRSGTTWSQQAELSPSIAQAGAQFGYFVDIDNNTAVVCAPYEPGVGGIFQGAAYAFFRAGTTWSQQARLTASDGAAFDYFGAQAVISGDSAFIGSVFDDGLAGADQGSVYVFGRSGVSWSEQAKLTASDAAANDQFGRSLEISGTTLLVGAFGHNSSTGAAYIFDRSGAVWLQTTKLTASDGAAGDSFGGAVVISGDTAVVGAAGADGGGGFNQGAAYAFVRSAGIWTEEAKLTPLDASAGDFFGGQSLALDGDRLLVGAAFDDGGAGSDQGSVYVFEQTAGLWNDEAKLLLSDDELSSGDNVGEMVAAQGDTMVVGAPHDSGETVPGQGAVYVFAWNGSGWTKVAKLTASDAGAGDQFGISVALDGDYLVVGANSDDGSAGANQGSVYVFLRDGGVWTEQAKLIAPDAAGGDNFGNTVAISGDTIVVGTPLDDLGLISTDDGSAHVFVRSGETWTWQAKLTALDAGGSDYFGFWVDIDGETVVATAPQDDTGASPDRGSAYVFVRSGTSWGQQSKLVASDAQSFDYLGGYVAIDGDTVIVGAEGVNLTFPTRADAGAAYVFVRSGTAWSQQAKLTASNASPGNLFGYSVDISGDSAIVGAINAAGTSFSDAGATYAFLRQGTTWTEQEILKALDGQSGDQFGFSAAIGGRFLAIGAPLDDGAAGADEGGAYVFNAPCPEGAACDDLDLCTFNDTCTAGVCIGEPNTDCDGDGVIDPGDNCPNVANPVQEDADNDGVGSACDNCVDVPNPGQADWDGNGIGDACDFPEPLAISGDDLCVGGASVGQPCAQNSDCPGGFCQVKNRFITAEIPASATSHGLKLTIVNLDTNSAATPANYNGTDRWVGAPTLGINDGVSSPFSASKTQCSFLSSDWGAVGRLHIYGDVVVPASQYDVSSCDPQANCSATLRIATAKFGDVVTPVNTVNFQDVNSIVAKFQGAPSGPSKTRAKLTNSTVNPASPINFQEVSACVSAFQSKHFKAVVTAPSATCP